MGDQVYFEDVQEGMEIPTLRKDPTTQQLVKYAGASGDYYQIHYDQTFAKGNGLPDVILHGALKNAFLGQFVTDWIGEGGTLKKLSCQYRGMDVPGVPMYISAEVVGKSTEGGENLVELKIEGKNNEGKVTTPGKATVALPSRG